MQIILLEKIKNLGELGETVKVKPGFARNFLFPSQKAVPATPENLAEFESRRAELEKLQADTVALASERASKLEGVSVTILRKAGDSGKLFGSVGPTDVADAINSAVEGMDISRKEVQSPGASIREIGEYKVDVVLHADVVAPIDLLVEAEP